MFDLNVEVIFTDPRIKEAGLWYGSDGAAAIDLRAAIDTPIEIYPGHSAILIPTGLKIWIKDKNYAGIIAPRSGNGHKRGLVIGNTFGLIDSDYQGEWMVSAWVRPNGTDSPIVVEPLERIAQMFFTPIVHPTFKIVDEFHDVTERGEGGHGSTGTH